MKRLNSLLHLILVCLIFTPVNAQGKRSLDEIDSESFQADHAPFDKRCVSVNLIEKPIKHYSAPEDIMLNGDWQLVGNAGQIDHPAPV